MTLFVDFTHGALLLHVIPCSSVHSNTVVQSILSQLLSAGVAPGRPFGLNLAVQPIHAGNLHRNRYLVMWHTEGIYYLATKIDVSLLPAECQLFSRNPTFYFFQHALVIVM